MKLWLAAMMAATIAYIRRNIKKVLEPTAAEPLAFGFKDSPTFALRAFIFIKNTARQVGAA